MAGDNYDKFIGTLTYLEAGKINRNLDSLKGQIESQERLRRLQEHNAREAEDEFLELIQRYNSLSQSEPSPVVYYNSEILRVRFKNFDESYLNDFSLRERMVNLREEADAMRNRFAAALGLENQRMVNRLFELPEKIEAARGQYLASAGFEATRTKPLLGAAGMVGLGFAAALLGFAWALAEYWDTYFVGLIDGRFSYVLAPILLLAGAALLVFLMFGRWAAHRSASKQLASARSDLHFDGDYPVLPPRASRRRLEAAKKESGWHMVEEEPHAIDTSTQSSLLKGIRELEQKLQEANRYTFG